MTPALELPAQLPKIVDFSVIHDPESIVGPGHRLSTGAGKVQDAQPAQAQGHGIVLVDPAIVGPTGEHGLHHALYSIPIGMPQDAGDSAH